MKAQQIKQKTDSSLQPKANKQSSHSFIFQNYKDKTALRKSANEEELLQGKFETTQLATEEEEPFQQKTNNTGLPNNLKTGIENLSGYSMDDVKVHYNSDKPAQLQAHAYAQGTDIHVSPGQEKHLPHEAWHIVQQKQGRVKPTMQMKGKVNVNDDAGLEKEADVMGRRALLDVVQRAGKSEIQNFISQENQPVQLMGYGSLMQLGGAGLAMLGAGAIALGSPLLGLAGLSVGSFLGISGMAMGDGRKRSPNYGTRPRSSTPTDRDWYTRRRKTAYGYTTGLDNQGPHTYPHIGKVVAAEHGIDTNPNFDPVAISERTGVIPSAGQQRALLRIYEENIGSTIPDAYKRKHDVAYKDTLDRRNTGTHKERIVATQEAMELNALSTYSLEKKATHNEIKGKGERRKTVTSDLEKMTKMKKGGPMPKFDKVDISSSTPHDLEHLVKLARDLGQIYDGNDDLSEFELDSDDEY